MIRLLKFAIFVSTLCIVSIKANEPKEVAQRFSLKVHKAWKEKALNITKSKESYETLGINRNVMPPKFQEDFDRLDKLPPIESFFIEPETVCLPDDREAEYLTEKKPWSGVCQLLIEVGVGSYARGSGFLISPTCVLTAGHCVHEGENGKYFLSVEVIPGCRGNYRPFGSKTSSLLKASEGWKVQGTPADDFGLVILDKPFEPDQNGNLPYNFTLANLEDVVLESGQIYVTGYPSDKPFGTQWSDTDPIQSLTPTRLFYNSDTYEGHSGSPILFGGESGPVVGIHNYGGCSNKCTRINASVKAEIETWIKSSQ